MMKRKPAVALALITILLMCLVPASALIPGLDADGMYAISNTAISNPSTYNSTICSESDTKIEGTNYYPDSVRFTVTSSAVSGTEYMVYVLNAQSTPTAENIFYVNQAKASGSTISFSVYPKNMVAGQYYVYVVGGTKLFDAANPLATFKYYTSTRFSLSVNVAGLNFDINNLLVKDTNGKTVYWDISDSSSVGFASIGSGNYTITLGGQAGYVPHSGLIHADDGGEISLTLVRPGNLNGIGNLPDPGDMQCLYTYISTGEKEGELKDDEAYFETVADVNGDGTTNILDYQALYEMVRTES